MRIIGSGGFGICRNCVILTCVDAEIECREGDEYVINGHKWWTSGAMDPRCRLLIVMVSVTTSSLYFQLALWLRQSVIEIRLDCTGGTGDVLCKQEFVFSMKLLLTACTPVLDMQSLNRS